MEKRYCFAAAAHFYAKDLSQRRQAGASPWELVEYEVDRLARSLALSGCERDTTGLLARLEKTARTSPPVHDGRVKSIVQALLQRPRYFGTCDEILRFLGSVGKALRQRQDLERARLLDSFERWDEALDVCRRLVRAHRPSGTRSLPVPREVARLFACAAARTGRLAAGLSLLKRNYAAAREHDRATRDGWGGRRTTHYHDMAHTLVGMAEACALARERSRALRYAERVERMDVDLNRRLCRFHVEHGSTSRARTLYLKHLLQGAASRFHRSVLWLHEYPEKLYRRGERQAAIELFGRLAREYQENGQAFGVRFIGKFLVAQGDTSSAQPFYTRAWTIIQNHDPSHVSTTTFFTAQEYGALLTGFGLHAEAREVVGSVPTLPTSP